MKDKLELLKQYFENTSRDQVLKDWQKAKDNAPKSNVKLKDFLNTLNKEKTFDM